MTYSISATVTSAQFNGIANAGTGLGCIVGLDATTGFGATWDENGANKSALPSLAGWTSSVANAVSSNCETVVGSAVDGSGNTIPVAWYRVAGVYSAAVLSTTSGIGAALDISDDELTIAGWSNSAFATAEPWVWIATAPKIAPSTSQATATSGIPTWNASGISADGTVFVGGYNSSTIGQIEAFYWNPPTGSATALANTGSPSDAGWFANKCSRDGSVIVGGGFSSGTVISGAYSWLKSTGAKTILALPSGTASASAKSCSADGSVIIGRGVASGLSVAVVWDSSGASILPAISGASGALGSGRDISGDGSLIVGFGNNASAVGSGIVWKSSTPPPSASGSNQGFEYDTARSAWLSAIG